MSQRITAVVEQGHLRPTTPLNLAEGTEVQIVIESVAAPPPPKPRRSPEEVRRIIAEIAAMPTEGDHGDPNASRDHDRILYGGTDAR
jgi:predicted DNA-binding antitoxin AbrB/MazE fold protein